MMNPQSKARQFWLAQRYDDRYEGFELPCGDYSNWKGAIKVIEKSAYDKAVEALKDISKHKSAYSGASSPEANLAKQTLRDLGVE